MADNEGQGDASPAQIDQLCFERLQQLAVLCSFYRPLLICFDQTEFFVNDRALIETFGKCVQRLFSEVPNQLTVITANSENWSENIHPFVLPANLARIAPPIELEGIRKEGARELIVQRLQQSGFSEAAILDFLSGNWLESVYSVIQESSVRSLLARAAERFSQLADREPPKTPSLEALFDEGLKAIRQKASLQDYDADALIWFLKDLGSGLPGVSVSRPGDRKYFSLQWNRSDFVVAFAFEGGCHWKRWKSIAEEAARLAEVSGKQPLRTYVFRTPDLDKVPKPSWAAAQIALDKAKSLGFEIRALDVGQVCEIHAARALCSDALQGNIDHGGPETLAWLQARFLPFLDELAKPLILNVLDQKPTDEHKPEHTKAAKPIPEATKELTAAQREMVETLVRELKLVHITMVLSSLGGGVDKKLLEYEVKAHKIKNVTGHFGKQHTHLQWHSHI